MLWQILVGRVRAPRVWTRRASGRAGRGVRGATVLRAGAVHRAAHVGVAEILCIALPADTRRVELVEEGWHARRVHASVGARRGVGPLRGHDLTEVRVRQQRTRGVDRSAELVIE